MSIKVSSRDIQFVQALLASDDQFPKLWSKWKRSAGPYADLAGVYLDLFPYVYHRLSHSKRTDSWMSVITNSYRHHWLHNQLLFRSVLNAMSSLKYAGVESWMLKGGAWIARHYPDDLGVRKIEDIDLYVEPRNFVRSVKILTSIGWEVVSFADMRVFSPDFFHAVSLSRGSEKIDLHCHIFHHYYSGNDTQIYRPRLNKLKLLGQTTTVLGDSDQLVHISVNRATHSEQSDLRWIIDMVHIIRTDHVDWERVVRVARLKSVSLAVLSALEYLRDNLDLDIPVHVLVSLRSNPTSLMYRRLYYLSSRGIAHSPTRAIEYYWWMYYQSLVVKKGKGSWYYQAQKYIFHLTETDNIGRAIWMVLRNTVRLIGRFLRGLAYA